MLKDSRLRQGSWAWPALNGVETGPLVDWWNRSLLNLEGDDHRRLRKLLNPAFTPGLVNGLAPRFRALATELIDGFAARGRCEFVSEFAEPDAARVIAIMLGIPEAEWGRLAQLSSDLGLFLGVTIAEDLDRIEAYRGTVSLPFEGGDHKRAAVKIVDDRGIESLKIIPVA